MSRLDPKDVDPGLRSTLDRDPGLTGFVSLQTDRRQSQGTMTYGGGHMRTLEQKERDFSSPNDSMLGPNRSNPTHYPHQPISAYNHHLQLYRTPPPPHSHPSPPEQGTLYQSSTLVDRKLSYRQAQPNGVSLPSSTNNYLRSTLLWANIEPWMDEEYAKQVCGIMGWDPVNIKVPQPTPDANTGQQANNPGFCYLTFPTPAHAASVLAQINSNGKGGNLTMPNSNKPFVLNWAPAVPPSVPVSTTMTSVPPAYTSHNQQYQKEYSIFVGDLAPETSNSDLVAVFRNPVLGLRNDREPKFIRPFLSCKSAKIMLDPATGVSRGYGFVRFTDEADQQRALIEMHGLYCLSRPMRISPATAKFKPPQPLPLEQLQGQAIPGADNQAAPITLPLPAAAQAKSVSAPIAATNSNNSIGTNSAHGSASSNSLGGSTSAGSMSSGIPSTIAQGFSGSDVNGVKLSSGTGVPSLLSEAQLRQVLGQNDGYLVNEESWKHHAQARAILGNLIGPNGEQLTSTDPYNTTVFVGGLSPLISEETLRTFFAPFGDIHYVKVPVGKHCGFVQFVRKADAERAIDKMQGFPIGGSRIRLSWGRSQYKAAQAAAQAAQAAALQNQFSAPTTPTGNGMTSDQALQLLYKLAQQGYIPGASDAPQPNVPSTSEVFTNNLPPGVTPEAKMRSPHEAPHNVEAFNGYLARPETQRSLMNFSPFSPELNVQNEEGKGRESLGLNTYNEEGKGREPFGRTESLPHPSRAYAPGFYPNPLLQIQDFKPNITIPAGKFSPSATTSAPRYGSYLDASDRPNGRPEPISRPSSGQTMASGRVSTDPLVDLNNTLSHLDLDRPWRSPDVLGGGTSHYRGSHNPSSPTV